MSFGMADVFIEKDNKPTDNEIIKALEDKTHKAEYSWVDSSYCDIEISLLKNALDLIKRLQEEIENLEYKLLGVMHFVDKWLDGAELEQDEVNRASAMREKTLQIVEKQQAEIERLEEDSKRLKKVQMQLDDLCIMHHTIRAEAIKEFAERLKEPNRWRDEDIYYIDTLVEEMVGEE